MTGTGQHGVLSRNYARLNWRGPGGFFWRQKILRCAPRRFISITRVRPNLRPVCHQGNEPRQFCLVCFSRAAKISKCLNLVFTRCGSFCSVCSLRRPRKVPRSKKMILQDGKMPFGSSKQRTKPMRRRKMESCSSAVRAFASGQHSRPIFLSTKSSIVVSAVRI